MKEKKLNEEGIDLQLIHWNDIIVDHTIAHVSTLFLPPTVSLSLLNNDMNGLVQYDNISHSLCTLFPFPYLSSLSNQYRLYWTFCSPEISGSGSLRLAYSLQRQGRVLTATPPPLYPSLLLLKKVHERHLLYCLSPPPSPLHPLPPSLLFPHWTSPLRWHKRAKRDHFMRIHSR